MMTKEANLPEVKVRLATLADLDALTAIRGPEVLHRGRLRDAEEPTFHYLVLEHRQQIVGFSCLVIQRPLSWSDAANYQQLPQIVDLLIAPAQRNQGYGTLFLRKLEHIASKLGYFQLYLSVDPIDNPRAHTLYQRLGYRPLQDAPYRDHWEWTDSDGHRHIGDEWAVDMVKTLE